MVIYYPPAESHVSYTIILVDFSGRGEQIAH